MLAARRLVPLLAVLGSLVIPAAAGAAPFDPTGFRFSSPTYTVSAGEGVATITITRGDTSREAQIRYFTGFGTAVRYADYKPVKDMIDFAPGQASATFTVPVVDHHIQSLPRNLKLSLFGPSPIGLATPSDAILTIRYDDPVTFVKNPLNPLGLATDPPPSNPLLGANLFRDLRYSLAATQARQWHHSHPKAAAMLDVITRAGEVHRFGAWSGPRPALQVAQYLQRAADEEPGTVPEFSTYWIVYGHCGNWSDPPSRVAAYHNWIQSLAQGIGQYRAIVFLEMDSLITVGCLSRHGVQVRMNELRDAVNTLSQLPRAVVYLDAGAADALPANEAASLLRRAGVSHVQGFFLNSTHFDWTSSEIRYGQQIARMTGGKHFVVNTAENGRGPLVPPDRVHQGNEVLCNPPGRGLGPLPTFNTGYRYVDAFAWIANPGKSGGQCRTGAPPTGFFWPQLALELVRNADFRVR